MTQHDISSIILIIMAIFITSCSQEEPQPKNTDNLPLSVIVTDGGYDTSDNTLNITRTTENGFATEFTEGDLCGLYIVRSGTAVYDNVKLTATPNADGSVSWLPEPGITLSGGPNDRYFLYYPYQEDMTGKTNAASTDSDTGFFTPLISGWKVQDTQTTYTDYTLSDLMTANGIATQNADGKLTLTFTMSHRMALAVIDVPTEVYMYKDNGTAINTIPVPAKSVDFTDSDVKPYAMDDGSYRYIINPTTPVTMAGSYAEGRRLFTVTLSGIAAGKYKTYKIEPNPQPH